LAAVDFLRVHLPELRVRVVNVVDLLCLQSRDQHPHGLTDDMFASLFTRSAPVIFAFHGYPSLIHRLTYKRPNHDNFHVHGYREEGTTTTPFDMTVRNELDRFHLAADAIDRAKRLDDRGAHAQQTLRDKLLEHRRYIEAQGEDMPEIRQWRWPSAASTAAKSSRGSAGFGSALTTP